MYVLACGGMGCVGVAGYNARAGLQLPTATNHFDRVQSIQMPRAARYAKAKLFFCPGKVLQTTQGTCTHCTHTHSGANCTIGTVARTEREKEKRRKTLCERATACKTALSVVATHTNSSTRIDAAAANCCCCC